MAPDSVSEMWPSCQKVWTTLDWMSKQFWGLWDQLSFIFTRLSRSSTHSQWQCRHGHTGGHEFRSTGCFWAHAQPRNFVLSTRTDLTVLAHRSPLLFLSELSLFQHHLGKKNLFEVAFVKQYEVLKICWSTRMDLPTIYSGLKRVCSANESPSELNGA